MKAEKELLNCFEDKNCDYERCRDIIRELGGCTALFVDKYNFKTNALFESVRYGHYDFAFELIKEHGADFNVTSDFGIPLMWDLQYLNSEAEEDRWKESENKLRLIRAMIKEGADPNPMCDGDNLLDYIRFKIGEGDEDYPSKMHLWQMEHIIEAHVHGETERFLTKLKKQGIGRIMLSDWGYWLMDDDLCDCEHAIFVFEDGERMALSSYQVGDDEWDFYAVPVRKDIILDPAKHHTIEADNNDSIKYLSWYVDEDCPTLHWLDLFIDDAVLRIHADEPNITVGIVCHDFNDYEKMKRKNLFLDKE